MKKIWNFLVKACKVTLNEIIKPMLLPWLAFMLVWLGFAVDGIDTVPALITSCVLCIAAYCVVFHYGANYRKYANVPKEKLTIVKEVDNNGNLVNIFYLSSNEIDKLIDIEIIEYKDSTKNGEEN